MWRRLAVILGLLIAVAPAVAQAQDKPVDINFGFGWMFPMTNLKNDFDAGWNGSFGATYNISPTLGIQGEYIYARMGGPDKTINIATGPGLPATSTGILESNHQMHIGSFNLVYKAP